jgi:hypothetical protein
MRVTIRLDRRSDSALRDIKKFTILMYLAAFLVISYDVALRAWGGGLAREQGVPGQPAVIGGAFATRQFVAGNLL